MNPFVKWMAKWNYGSAKMNGYLLWLILVLNECHFEWLCWEMNVLCETVSWAECLLTLSKFNMWMRFFLFFCRLWWHTYPIRYELLMKSIFAILVVLEMLFWTKCARRSKLDQVFILSSTLLRARGGICFDFIRVCGIHSIQEKNDLLTLFNTFLGWLCALTRSLKLALSFSLLILPTICT